MYTNAYATQLNGHELILRNAREDEAEMLRTYFKTVCGESRFLIKEPEEVNLTLEEEQAFIRRQNESDRHLMLLGFLDGDYVGNCSFNGNASSRFRHRATVGIALYQKYAGLGIGKIMLEKLIEVAKETGFEQLELEVVADNQRAIALYTKMGFRIYGTYPRNMKYKDGTYADAYWMMRAL